MYIQEDDIQEFMNLRDASFHYADLCLRTCMAKVRMDEQEERVPVSAINEYNAAIMDLTSANEKLIGRFRQQPAQILARRDTHLWMFRLN